MRDCSKKKSQSVLNYTLIIGVVVGALLTTQAYLKRGLQGRLKGLADEIGEQFLSPEERSGRAFSGDRRSSESQFSVIQRIEKDVTSFEKEGWSRTETRETFDLPR